MRILYVVPNQPVPGSHGGSTHVLEVAGGLTRRGHEVRVAAKRSRLSQKRVDAVEGILVQRMLYRVPRFFTFLALPTIWRLVRGFEPHVVMERYYNFGGAGTLCARLYGIPSILEVNSPLVEPPGSLKTRVDFLLLGTLKRWREALCRWSAKIVTPLEEIIPPSVPRSKIELLSWGANVDLFDPARFATGEGQALVERLRERLGIAKGKRVVVFLGSFRRWHGVQEFAQAADMIVRRGRADIHFLTIGAGPLYNEIQGFVRGRGLAEHFTLTGAIEYDQVPQHLALANVAVAPFNTAAHPYLRLGFYWSPLKVFEYMAMGLPVVTIDIEPLNQIVRDEEEGLLFPEGDWEGLAERVLRLLDNPDLAHRLGEKARWRVVEGYSWQKHCQQLDRIIRECVG